jgi:cytochrome c553
MGPQQEAREGAMYFTDTTHFLDENGAVAPRHAAGQELADFLGNVIATATSLEAASAAPACFKCHAATMVSPPLAGLIEVWPGFWKYSQEHN